MWYQYQLMSILLASFQPASVISGMDYQKISVVLKPGHLRKHSAFSFTAFLLRSRTLLFSPRRSLGISGRLQGRRQLPYEPIAVLKHTFTARAVLRSRCTPKTVCRILLYVTANFVVPTFCCTRS